MTPLTDCEKTFRFINGKQSLSQTMKDPSKNPGAFEAMQVTVCATV
jgi:hypothetical protein